MPWEETDKTIKSGHRSPEDFQAETLKTIILNPREGIDAIVAAAAAMYGFANSMNTATASMQNFNSTTAQTATATRKIIRAGEDELYRRGVE